MPECGFCGNENVAPPVVREAKALNFEPAPSPNGSSRWGAPLRVIRAVTVRYIRRWLVGWLLFRCHAPGSAGRAPVPGDRSTGVGRFRIAGGRSGVLAGLRGMAEPEAGAAPKNPYEAKGRGTNHPHGPTHSGGPKATPSSCRLQVSRCRWREGHRPSGNSGLSARCRHGRPSGDSCIGHGRGAIQGLPWRL